MAAVGASIGQYDSTFKVFTAVSGGTQMGGDITVNDVQVTAGVFMVNLNFGALAFINKPPLHLEIAGGSVYVANPNSLIITSPNGACWFITVNNAGAFSTISVTCL